MKILLSIILFLLVASFAKAQNQDSLTIKKYYEENAIFWPGWTKYIKNNKAYPLKDLEKEIIYSKEAQHEFALYKKNRTYLEIGLITSIGLLTSALVVKDNDLKRGLAAGSILTATLTLPFSFSTSKHLGKAIWLHNRDILLK